MIDKAKIKNKQIVNLKNYLLDINKEQLLLIDKMFSMCVEDIYAYAGIDIVRKLIEEKDYTKEEVKEIFQDIFVPRLWNEYEKISSDIKDHYTTRRLYLCNLYALAIKRNVFELFLDDEIVLARIKEQ